MLTQPERILFLVAVLASIYAAWFTANRIIRIIKRGQGKFEQRLDFKHLLVILLKILTFQPVFRFRFWVSLLHNFIAWAFIYYLLVNLVDVVIAYLPEFHVPGMAGNMYRLGADILSVLALFGMVSLVIRRFIIKPSTLTTRSDVLLHPKARIGITRDSAIVASFIIIHVGSRFLGESIRLVSRGKDPWQPFASITANLWMQVNPTWLSIGEHLFFWSALGTILLFIPYFLYSKHIHVFMAPINLLLKPEGHSSGELNRLNFEDESVEQFGATRIEHLGWEQILDSYACIMCYRCQQVCPAFTTGKVLSPAAYEINKRYFLNIEGKRISQGNQSQQTLLEFAITKEAIWACTTCGACVDICPVGNEPMRDIIEIRRSLVLMESNFPDLFQSAFRGMERSSNPWNISPSERLKWADGLSVQTIEHNPHPEILWWVGCAPATDARAQKTARAFVKILNHAAINYAVLGQQEQCTGDSARRAGNEFLFNEMAIANVEVLNEAKPKKIVTTCPHCLHTIRNEYPAFGGQYHVIHHSQLISELLSNDKLVLKDKSSPKITFHDPCYLSRHNTIQSEPRQVIIQSKGDLIEMPQHGRHTFCCGAGGSQMWKEEEKGVERINSYRFREAQTTGAEILAVSCPFCMIMLTDAKKDAGSDMEVKDIAEIIAELLIE